MRRTSGPGGLETEMAALLSELADPVRLAMVAELALSPAGIGTLAASAGREPAEAEAALAALAAIDVVEGVEARAGGAYRLVDPELGTACAALRSALVCRLVTAERLDEFVALGAPRRPAAG